MCVENDLEIFVDWGNTIAKFNGRNLKLTIFRTNPAYIFLVDVVASVGEEVALEFVFQLHGLLVTDGPSLGITTDVTDTNSGK